MPDSIESLGSYEVFPFLPNYRENLDNTFVASITENRYRGGSVTLINNKEYTPIIVRALYTLYGKEEISDTLDFIEGRRARKDVFWYYLRTSDFKIKENISNGASSIVCYLNFYAQSYKTVDRFYFTLINGDTYVRRITNVIDDEYNQETTIEFTPSIDVAIDKGDITFFSRILFARLDLDEYELKYETDSKAEVSMRIVERPTEYPAT